VSEMMLESAAVENLCYHLIEEDNKSWLLNDITCYDDLVLFVKDMVETACRILSITPPADDSEDEDWKTCVESLLDWCEEYLHDHDAHWEDEEEGEEDE
jgi:hypothetical protein